MGLPALAQKELIELVLASVWQLSTRCGFDGECTTYAGHCATISSSVHAASMAATLATWWQTVLYHETRRWNPLVLVGTLCGQLMFGRFVGISQALLDTFRLIALKTDALHA